MLGNLIGGCVRVTPRGRALQVRLALYQQPTAILGATLRGKLIGLIREASRTTRVMVPRGYVIARRNCWADEGRGLPFEEWMASLSDVRLLGIGEHYGVKEVMY